LFPEHKRLKSWSYIASAKEVYYQVTGTLVIDLNVEDT
jgi:hypothetical protein